MIAFLSPGWGFVLYPLFGCCLSVLPTRVCIRVLPRLAMWTSRPAHVSVSCAATSCLRRFSSGIPSARSSG